MRRLDPRAILILSIEWLRAAVYPIVFSLIANGNQIMKAGKEERSIQLIGLGIPLAIGAFAILGAFISYMVTRFGIVNGSLVVIKKGLWRQERTIPLERIQNVMITQGLMERLLKIATVKVETASGSGVEASLKSVSVADAEQIKQELMMTRSATVPSEVGAPEPAVYKAELKDIALAGALQNRALFVMAAIMGVFNQGLDDFGKVIVDVFRRTPLASTAEHDPALAGLLTFVAVLVFLAIGWLLSILYAIFVYFGFKVVKTDRGLQVSYGLVNTVQTVIPTKRIQSIQTHASWLFKFFGLNQLFAQSIGGHAPTQGQHVAAGQTMIAPICRPVVLRTLIRLINPLLDIDKVKFLASDRFLLTRSLVRLTLGFGVVFGLFAFLATKVTKIPMAPFMIGCAALYALNFALAFLSFRRQGYAQTEDVFFVCSGTLGQNVTMIPITNIQAVSLGSGWFQRRKGLVDLHVHTPVSVGFVPCIKRETADQIRDELMARAYGASRTGL